MKQSDLINRDDLMKTIGLAVDCKDCRRAGTFGCNESSAFAYACECITDAPAVDAVEVIRCKDCKHWDDAVKYCDFEMGVSENDFCSWAERVDKNDTERAGN